MTSYMPPADRIWWKMPVGRQELVWIAISLVWCLVMFLMMPYWHLYGKQNLSTEAYQTTPAKFGAKVQAMIDKYQVREESGIPVVKPPVGSDVYMLGRLWQWYPILGVGEGPELPLAFVLHGIGSTDSPCNRLTSICR